MEDSIKYLLSRKLVFPEGWAGVSVMIHPTACQWSKFSDGLAMKALQNSGASVRLGVMYFYSWGEIAAAIKGPEKNNMQFYLLAETIATNMIDLQAKTNQIKMQL